ncbi:MAG: hypothetical protein KDB61_13675, partial [Planctomycetes bacterium]|nr:hypothetical protein [Planctomycetota bacterium]
MLRTLALCLCLSAAAFAQTSPQPGVNVYQPNASPDAYAVDLAGNVVHTWPGTNPAGITAVYMAPNGDLVRTLTTGTPPGGAGSGGGVERVSWDGQVVWSFTYSNAQVHSHHDIALMPNGNVLVIAWENVGAAGAIAAGRNFATVSTEFLAEQVIEIEPDGM